MPEDLRAAVRAYFKPGPSVDVGCGSGRDTAWLAGEGFDVFGVDAAPGLLAEARRRHPEVTFEVDGTANECDPFVLVPHEAL